MGCRVQNEEAMKMEEGLGLSPPQKGKFTGEVTLFVELKAKV